MHDSVSKSKWQNRIVGHGEKPAEEFQFNPLNWRKHPESQRTALREILDRIGWVTGVIENVTTGNLLDGHARVAEAVETKQSAPIPFIQVELTEDEERQILLLLDPLGSMATADEALLENLIEMVGLESDVLLNALRSMDVDITALIPQFDPASILDQGKMDELNQIKCPSCGHEFSR